MVQSDSARSGGKVALVTGGNSGLDRETAVGFARNGTRVVVVARRETEFPVVSTQGRPSGTLRGGGCGRLRPVTRRPS